MLESGYLTLLFNFLSSKGAAAIYVVNGSRISDERNELRKDKNN